MPPLRQRFGFIFVVLILNECYGVLVTPVLDLSLTEQSGLTARDSGSSAVGHDFTWENPHLSRWMKDVDGRSYGTAQPIIKIPSICGHTSTIPVTVACACTAHTNAHCCHDTWP
jgi:hypothetical protein